MARNFLIVAGEVSGDQHAAPLMRALQARNPDIQFFGLGGDDMTAAGLEPMQHVRDLAVTGFLEVFKQLSFFKSVMAEVLDACTERKPEAAILLDYPGFNLRLGAELGRMGIPVYYYISPQVWAWNRRRVKKMRRFVRHMYVIFPFEESFYHEAGIPASYAGHPLLDQDFAIPDRAAFFEHHQLDPDRPLVALLPGSRSNELHRHTPPLLSSIELIKKQRQDLQFTVAAVSSLPEVLYTPYKDQRAVKLIYDQPHALMQHADVAVVSSGTATLETAFFGTPMVVIYRIAALSYLIGRLLVKVDHLAMPNLIMNERVFPELIQYAANPLAIADWVQRFIDDPELRQKTISRMADLQQLLGEPGAVERISKSILSDLQVSHGT